MARGWRALVVDGVRYRWRMDGGDVVGPGPRVVVRAELPRAASMTTTFADGNLVTPYLVRVAIERARAHGWDPAAPGRPRGFAIAEVIADRPTAPASIATLAADEAALLDALADAADEPARVAALAVYVDALLARGDPRGEYASLVARREHLGYAGQVRLAELEATRDQLLGPIVDLTDGRRWDRGLFVGARLGKRATGVVGLALGHPGWATVQTLVSTSAYLVPAEAAAVIAHPMLRALRELEVDTVNARALLDAGAVLAIRTLRLIGSRRDTASAAVADVPAWAPRLATLVVPLNTASDLAHLAEVATVPALELLDPNFAVLAAARGLPVFADGVRRVTFDAGARLTFARGADGALSALAIALPDAQDAAVGAVVELAARLDRRALTAVTIEPGVAPARARALANAFGL